MRTYLCIAWRHVWMGDVPRMHLAAAELRKMARSKEAAPLPRLTWSWLEAIMAHFVTAGAEESLSLVAKGHELSRTLGNTTGDHWLHCQAANALLSKGDASGAHAQLEKVSDCLSNGPVEVPHYHLGLAWQRLLSGAAGEAVLHASRAVELAERSGLVMVEAVMRFACSQILLESGDLEAAGAHLRATEDVASRTGSEILHFACDLGWALHSLQRGDDSELHRRLASALERGRSRGITTVPWWTFSRGFDRLLARAIERDLAVEYACSLVRAHRLSPPREALTLERWPRPLELRCLGTFEVRRDGVPLQFEGKVQKKPLELLRALVALGGHEVPLAVLEEWLWPNAEGDAAHRSFETALYRLRKLLGVEGALRLQDGLLSLDEARVWCDANVLVHVADELRAPLDDDHRARVERAVALYRGAFLPADLGAPWAEAMREKLRGRYRRLVSTLAEHLEARSNWEEAIRILSNALESESCDEALHRRLISAHVALGEHAQAVRAYQRCERALERELGTAPSPRTRELVGAVRGAAKRSLTR